MKILKIFIGILILGTCSSCGSYVKTESVNLAREDILTVWIAEDIGGIELFALHNDGTFTQCYYRIGKKFYENVGTWEQNFRASNMLFGDAIVHYPGSIDASKITTSASCNENPFEIAFEFLTPVDEKIIKYTMRQITEQDFTKLEGQINSDDLERFRGWFEESRK